jgi:hypothetical protein
VAGIGANTLLRWLKVPEFQKAYREARRAAFSQSIARLQQGTSAAATTLIKLLLDPNTPASVRARVADSIFNHAAKAIEALSTTPYTFAGRYQTMESVANKNLPIVFLDDLEFLPFVHYAPHDLASRLVYILIPGLDVNGESHRVLQRLCGAPGKIDTMANFLSTHDAFLVQSNARSLYRLNYFIREGADVRVENASTDSFLASVTIKKGHGELASNTLQ